MSPDGVIVGGWGYVVATYSITGVVLVAYAAWLVIRLRRRR